MLTLCEGSGELRTGSSERRSRVALLCGWQATSPTGGHPQDLDCRFGDLPVQPAWPPVEQEGRDPRFSHEGPHDTVLDPTSSTQCLDSFPALSSVFCPRCLCSGCAALLGTLLAHSWTSARLISAVRAPFSQRCLPSPPTSPHAPPIPLSPHLLLSPLLPSPPSFFLRQGLTLALTGFQFTNC